VTLQVDEMQNEEQASENGSPDPEAMRDTAAGESNAAGVESSLPADEVNALKAELEDTKDQLLRTRAELENFRKRTQRERNDASRYESFRLVQDLLPAIDGLDLAMKSAEQSGDFQSLLDGIKMVYSQVLDVFKAHSTEQIPAEGKMFDPNLHEALTQIPTADVEPMTIVQVIETGYRQHDRVVRPARVVVAGAPPE
jgi:molecular chaperone GrpE